MIEPSRIRSLLLSLLISLAALSQGSDSLIVQQMRGEGVKFSHNNSVVLLTTGQEKFDDMFSAISRARHSVHLEYFNFRNDSIADRLFVTTIHKAKGLEFDNVIVFDVVDGRIPNYYSEGNPAQLAEDARKLYVAMSRARRRLFIAYSRQRQVGRDLKPQRLSRFMGSVRGMFKE